MATSGASVDMEPLGLPSDDEPLILDGLASKDYVVSDSFDEVPSRLLVRSLWRPLYDGVWKHSSFAQDGCAILAQASR